MTSGLLVAMGTDEGPPALVEEAKPQGGEDAAISVEEATVANEAPQQMGMCAAPVANMLMPQISPQILPKPRSSFSQPAVMDMPEFELDDTAAWLQHLETTGAVRLRGVLRPADVANVKSLFWDWLESLGGGAQRDQPETWTDANFPGLLDKGFFCTRGGGQCKAAWAIRGNRRVHRVFAEIWRTGDLLTSFDTFIGWRPWWRVGKAAVASRPRTEGIHCDQNPHTKPGLMCVQGMVPLQPVTRGVGGLCVVPGSHMEGVQSRLRELFPATTSDDWLPLETKYPKDELNLCGELIEANPGDMILWDSRALHGGYVGPGSKIGALDKCELARLSFAVCMLPRGDASQENLQKRLRLVEAGNTTTHWPLAFKKHASRDTCGSSLLPFKQWQDSYKPPDLDAWAQCLIRGPELS